MADEKKKGWKALMDVLKRQASEKRQDTPPGAEPGRIIPRTEQERAEYATFRTRILQDLEPRGPSQVRAAERAALAMWRLKLLEEAESRAMAEGAEKSGSLAGTVSSMDTDNLAAMEKALEDDLRQALDELDHLRQDEDREASHSDRDPEEERIPPRASVGRSIYLPEDPDLPIQ